MNSITPHYIQHVNPSCLDSNLCLEHGENDEVTYKNVKYIDSVVSANQARIGNIGGVLFGMNLCIKNDLPKFKN